MSEKQTDNDGQEESNTVRNFALTAAGVGLVPAPIWDFFAIAGVQTSMMYKLCNEYDVPFSKERAKTIGTSLIGSLTAASLATGVAGSLLKIIPGFGYVLGGLNFSIWAGATTYALGRVFESHLATGGTLMSFDTSSAKTAFSEAFEKGKQFVSRKKVESPA